jgi:uncharacterized protein YbjT (DUF2867 family)
MSRVLVYQANGVQGSATLRHVLQAGFTARALLRSTSKAAELTSRGVEVAVADLTDREGLIRAHQSVDHVVMQIPAYGDAFVKTAVENAVCAMQVARVGGVILKMSNPTSSHATPDSGFSANGIVRKAMQSARRMLSIPARGPSVADNFAPTFLPDWIRKNRASFARES